MSFQDHKIYRTGNVIDEGSHFSMLLNEMGASFRTVLIKIDPKKEVQNIKMNILGQVPRSLSKYFNEYCKIAPYTEFRSYVIGNYSNASKIEEIAKENGIELINVTIDEVESIEEIGKMLV